MSHAYSPGLKIVENEKITRRRILPIKGETLVNMGQFVKSNDVVARTYLPGDAEPINLAHRLGISPAEITEALIKKVGDSVIEKELIAESKGIFGFFKNRACATKNGVIESISNITGHIIIRGKPVPIELNAYIDGVITKIIPDLGVEITTGASIVQGIFGVGGETNGHLVFACQKPDEILDENMISVAHSGKIIVGGQFVTARALSKAVSIGAKGIISGGIDDKDLRDFLHYDIGVAITGSENIGLTLIITEGFSNIRMNQSAFDLLKKNEGKFACINGSTQIRAGVVRPEIIIPKEEKITTEILKTSAAENNSATGIRIGSHVRIIREPYFGKLGIITELPSALQRLESQSLARVCRVKIDSRELIIPRANIEIVAD